MITKHLTKTQNAIGLLILFCVTVFLLRVQYTQSLFFSFLLWNIFLATLPYMISESMKKYQPKKTPLFVIIGIWVLFLPNAPYIITDFVHLHHLKSTMLWYDIFMIFCFANTGLLLAIISMNDVYKIIQLTFNTKIANRFISVVTVLCGFGIYLGRFLRFNSWDFFTRPFSVIRRSLLSLTSSTAWLITLGFACLLWMLFSLFQNLNTTKKRF